MLVERKAAAKINLGLHVLRRRSDGYHDLATVFLRIGWTDRLQAEKSDEVAMTCSDPALPVDDSNLCLRAAHLLRARTRVTGGVRLHLEKRIPYGAGLGGGSSDAAATLRLLADLWKLDVSRETLLALAAHLGSDVPFFLLDETAAYATGRGERLQPLPDGAGRTYTFPYRLVVAMPPVHVSTAEAYRLVTPSAVDRPDLPALVASNDLAAWRVLLRNDFEKPILARYPEIKRLKEALVEAGAGYAQMSGSGAAVFGVFEEEEQARAAAERMRAGGVRVWWGGADA